MTRHTLIALLLVSLLPTGAAAQVSFERLLRADEEPENWLTYSGSYKSQRHSQLDQITPANVTDLELRWVFQARSLEVFQATPLVVDGIMYLVEPTNTVVALDAKLGRVFWTYEYTPSRAARPCCGAVNRGLAILDNSLFLATIDANLVALDATSGKPLWKTNVGDPSAGYALTLAPLVIKDKVVVGIAGGEYGIRGFIAAYDAQTGEEAWKFYTIPGPGEPGHETWQGDDWEHGGAPVWLTGSYDPDLNLTYWGIGNPGPDWNPSQRPGDNLYSESLIALDPDTGELEWYFQFLPHDVHDYDSTQVPVLLDAALEGEPRKLLLFPNRNGFYYVLDRVTGEFLVGKPFARQTWAIGLDEDGRPIENPETIPSTDGALVYPDDDGAANWYSPTYSPQTHLIYQNVREKGGIYYLADATYEPGKIYMGASRRVVSGEDPKGFLRALDALTGDLVWELEVHAPPWAGLMSTAGGLVFSGTMEGDFFAADARTGAVLWRFQTGGSVYANPITYLSEGRQFIAIAAGSGLFTFALPE